MITVKRDFPLPRIQTGAMSGNGDVGLLLWGGGNVLNITLGSSRVWDHRGGMDWLPEMSLSALRQALKDNDGERVSGMFAANRDKNIMRPSIIPVGRLVLTLPPDCVLLRYEQPLQTGLTDIVYECGGREQRLTFAADMSCVHAFACSGLPWGGRFELIPSYTLCQPSPKLKNICEFQTLAARGFTKPASWKSADAAGFIQPMPADESFAVVVRQNCSELSCDLLRGLDDLAQLEAHDLPTFGEICEASVSWWTNYWQGMPTVSTADEELDEIYWHGLYKYGIMTNPAGYPPGLQGPWIEDDHTPPWSGDYHLNINLQMYMTPGFKAGKFTHLRPCFDMILSWRPLLRQFARSFLGLEDGYVLPHAVDDHGICQGNFWTGTVDHACGAWIAMMMFDYCEYTGDVEYLRTRVWDFMLGVMRVYEAVLERDRAGNYCLPLSVSPEYNSDELGAYGRNASFQLAALHRHILNLRRAAAWLGLPQEQVWKDIAEHLPQVSVQDGEIALWDGLLLGESHRHHSHLGCIYPFATLAPEMPEWTDIIKASILRWIILGNGQWTGWCVPWASIIHTRLGNPECAVHMLRSWKYFFTNEGGGSLHDSIHDGFTLYSNLERGEIMQIDGSMGAVTAVQELFVYEREGVITLFAGIPERWPAVSFENMAVAGGFRFSGTYGKGRAAITVRATRSGTVRFRLRSGEIHTATLQAGESRTVTIG